MTNLLHARINSKEIAEGRFEMTLATEGEATDGDILSIDGGEIPERMPLLVSHFNDPVSQAGSITNARKHRASKGKPASLTATGEIELEGEGVPAEIRRDLRLMIEKGHVGAVSIRWDPLETVRRANLPSDHPFFVDAEKETDWRKRYGLLHTKWRAMEGSIVSVGADPEALIRCADAADTPKAEAFWRRMAFEAESDHTWERSQDTPRPIEPVDSPLEVEVVEPEVAPIQQRTSLLELDPADLRSPFPIEQFSAILEQALDGYEDRLQARVDALIGKRTGKVT